MQRINIKIHGQYPECQTKNCPLTKECANHKTAGNMRTKKGMTPKMFNENGLWFCHQTDNYCFGCLYIQNKKNLQLVLGNL
jgi:hypothetical protein